MLEIDTHGSFSFHLHLFEVERFLPLFSPFYFYLLGWRGWLNISPGGEWHYPATDGEMYASSTVASTNECESGHGSTAEPMRTRSNSENPEAQRSTGETQAYAADPWDAATAGLGMFPSFSSSPSPSASCFLLGAPPRTAAGSPGSRIDS
ncbi:hypothetical protein ASPFODRAFT_547671 [Aspergillus luchuensis CBS 106.47]|uniref:Uncharacterized protein n=1 Tax=Aspergillus luchuensis (strain CBS 106.47) TaxID=1137211 RepID=A0A1M3TNW5_ASPLC|nr:hypothetical protein ASPFODRAFT_547671 [Aspergillus luchuensis CBS 106.47]